MRIKALHEKFVMPTKSTEGAGSFDIYMPTFGRIYGACSVKCPLGFAAEVPPGHVALIVPRSSVGVKYGVELKNTCGVIDSDYRGEWIAMLRTKNDTGYSWEAGDRLLQFLIVPIADVELNLVDELDTTERGSGGFGSSGK